MIDFHIPGKLLLAGAYSVLTRGRSALVLAVDKTLWLHRGDAGANRIEIPRWELDLRDLGEPAKADCDPRERFVRGLFAATAAMVPGCGGVHIVAEPHRRDLLARDLGLGTSSALAVGFARALMPAEPATSRRILALALAAHDEVQGQPGSGADIAAAWAGRSIRFVRGGAVERGGDPLPEVEPLVVNTCPPMVILYSGKSRRTAAAVGAYRSLVIVKPNRIARFERDSERVVRAIFRSLGGEGSTPSTQAWIRSIDRAAGLRAGLAAALGMQPPISITTRAAVVAAGGAIKSCGALGGDCLLATAPCSETLQRVREITTVAGYEPLDLHPIFGSTQ